MANLTHWKKLDNPDYIGAYAFQPGETKTVTITGVAREMVIGTEGKKEECTVVRFAEEKPMVLNVTNAKTISAVAGTPYIEQWQGVRIVLGVERVRAFGDMVDAVRVKNIRPAKPSKPLPPCAACGGRIEGVGKASAQAVANASMKKFGEMLCAACATERGRKHAQEPPQAQLREEAPAGENLTDAAQETPQDAAPAEDAPTPEEWV